MDQPIVDGFTHSLSVLMLPTTYRAGVLAQMEVLRRTTNYQFKMFSAPDEANAIIPAYSQNEYLVRLRPGTLIWGSWLSASIADSLAKTFVQVTDMSTGLGLMSDYEIGKATSAALAPTPARVFSRQPRLLPGPRLVSGSGQLTIDIYNSSGVACTYQLVLYCAEPMPLPEPCNDPGQACPSW